MLMKNQNKNIRIQVSLWVPFLTKEVPSRSDFSFRRNAGKRGTFLLAGVGVIKQKRIKRDLHKSLSDTSSRHILDSHDAIGRYLVLFAIFQKLVIYSKVPNNPVLFSWWRGLSRFCSIPLSKHKFSIIAEEFLIMRTARSSWPQTLYRVWPIETCTGLVSYLLGKGREIWDVRILSGISVGHL